MSRGGKNQLFLLDIVFSERFSSENRSLFYRIFFFDCSLFEEKDTFSRTAKEGEGAPRRCLAFAKRRERRKNIGRRSSSRGCGYCGKLLFSKIFRGFYFHMFSTFSAFFRRTIFRRISHRNPTTFPQEISYRIFHISTLRCGKPRMIRQKRKGKGIRILHHS